MHDFRYVNQTELQPIKHQIIKLINLVQDEIRENFTFQYKFIGSVSRSMVTCDQKNNIGFDFDINIMVNDVDEDYSPSEIKHILMNGFNKFAREYGYDNCEDSTRVFTIKVKDQVNSRILHSCDFAIVNDCGDGKQQYIRFNKPTYYSWEYQLKGFCQLPDKINFCKKNKLWQDVRKLYLKKKNENNVPEKKSRSIFAETINEICQQNKYYC